MKWNSLHQWKACCWWSQRKRSCPPRIQESHLRGTWSVSHGWRDPSTFLLYLPFPIFWMILSINFLLFFLTFLKDVFTVSVGNLPPNTTAIIKITYVTELAVEGDDVIFTLPNSVAPSKKEKALKVSKFCFWSSFKWFSSDFFSFLFSSSFWTKCDLDFDPNWAWNGQDRFRFLEWRIQRPGVCWNGHRNHRHQIFHPPIEGEENEHHGNCWAQK